ncbi:hypothetical protein SAMN04487895_101616 [Paenibacillus sophorae]|uniref:Uncharacterized protein n=1 Tax=Paenibacillus sophorae TaxID=1333845 RepID=A0A1H8GTA5_9BACL|nr:hypothetical protein [Paenibacillus sophorae]QWU14313.1 hypothetical protein KP014_20620 [Paenibacillus sophorae]SEN46508.1 hypothetical protein SAMN04487895_101616 [Paenibacillus sophorae]
MATAEERETIIRSDDDCKTWSVYTLQQTIITKLRKVGAEAYKVDSDGGHYYKDLKFNQVSFRTGKERNMSDEQKQAASERFKEMHKNKNKKESE